MFFLKAAFGEGVLSEEVGLGVFVHHLGEEEKDKFGDVVAVVDAVVAEGVAEFSEFLDDVVVRHGKEVIRSGSVVRGCFGNWVRSGLCRE
ncbi:MAG: hypothetical protein ACI92G_001257 [Candidatus Pelagisphaera sp.]